MKKGNKMKNEKLREYDNEGPKESEYRDGTLECRHCGNIWAPSKGDSMGYDSAVCWACYQKLTD